MVLVLVSASVWGLVLVLVSAMVLALVPEMVVFVVVALVSEVVLVLVLVLASVPEVDHQLMHTKQVLHLREQRIYHNILSLDKRYQYNRPSVRMNKYPYKPHRYILSFVVLAKNNIGDLVIMCRTDNYILHTEVAQE
jgi:hypothetical protein